MDKLRRTPDVLEVLGNGAQRKPYIYVRDLVDAILFIRSRSHDQLNVYNVGVETATRVSDIAQMVIEAMRCPARINYTGGERGWVGDVPSYAYNLAKLHALGWTAPRTSDASVRLAIERMMAAEMS